MKYPDDAISKLIDKAVEVEWIDNADAIFQEDLAYLEGYMDARRNISERAEIAYENLSALLAGEDVFLC